MSDIMANTCNPSTRRLKEDSGLDAYMDNTAVYCDLITIALK